MVVSLPSWEIFEYYCRKHPGYREQVLPSSVRARVSVELASTFGWERYVGTDGRMIGIGRRVGATVAVLAFHVKVG